MDYTITRVDNHYRNLKHRSVEEMLTFLISQNERMKEKLTVSIEREIIQSFYRYYDEVYKNLEKHEIIV